MTGKQKAGVWILAVSALIGIVALQNDSDRKKARGPVIPNLNYSTQLCDDAFASEKNYGGTWKGNYHDHDDLTHIDVDLKDGCFGGMVTLPQDFRWNMFRMQLLHNQADAWVAIWRANQPNPGAPAGLIEFNQNPQTMEWSQFGKAFRLQGRGTLRIYKVWNP